MLKPKAFFLPLLLIAAPAAADPIEDGQLWSTVSASGSLSGKWQGQLETITRIGSDFSEHYQQEFLAGIGYELSDKATVSGGYVRVIDFRPGNDRTEHRPFQQLSLDLGKIGSAKLSSRTRLEQRFSRDQIEGMMERAGLTGIVFRDGVPFWVACGRKTG